MALVVARFHESGFEDCFNLKYIWFVIGFGWEGGSIPDVRFEALEVMTLRRTSRFRDE